MWGFLKCGFCWCPVRILMFCENGCLQLFRWKLLHAIIFFLSTWNAEGIWYAFKWENSSFPGRFLVFWSSWSRGSSENEIRPFAKHGGWKSWDKVIIIIIIIIVVIIIIILITIDNHHHHHRGRQPWDKVQITRSSFWIVYFRALLRGSLFITQTPLPK